MKTLSRMKLINWHRFTDCTIHFGDFTLLSGENGAGKSTLLDAIQFVITCSSASFNKAAHENGKRKLTGYIRCKTGREQRPYERTGEISAHIALEFYEENRNRYFIVGAVIDSASEGQETTVRYLIDDARIADELFFSGATPKSINEFRSSCKSIRQWCKTQTEAKKMIKSRFGRIEDKFFRLIPKALAFKPIDDIKDFVYSYVLDEKEVNIDVLRENVRTYQELERTLESVKRRLEKLETIEKHHDAVEDGLEKDRMYDFFLKQADRDITLEAAERSRKQINFLEDTSLEEEKRLQADRQEQKEKQEMAVNLRLELKQDKDFLALEAEQKQLASLEDEEKERFKEKQLLEKAVQRSLEQIRKLQNLGNREPLLSQYEQALEKAFQSGETLPAAECTRRLIDYKTRMLGENMRETARLQMLLQETKQERSVLNQKMEQLKRKKLSYSDSVTRLRDTIREDFIKLDRKTAPHVLCELLELTDESWRNAVEGYLNTQRFYILVEPENFDIALGAYDRLRKEKKTYGAGLINAYGMEQYEEAPEGSLAAVVESANPYARRYINMILGKVRMCDRYDQLKQHKTAITKECMKYQNRVASAIHPSVFEIPFIGQKAFRIQLAQSQQRLRQLDAQIAEHEETLALLEETGKCLNTEGDMEVKYRIGTLADLALLEQKIRDCRANIETLRKNAGFIQKQIQLSALEELCRELDTKIDERSRNLGSIQEQILSQQRQLELLSAREKEQTEAVLLVTEAAGDKAVFWKKEYEKQTEQKSFAKFRDNYDRRRKANETICREAERKMVDAMILYKTEHDFGAAPSMEGFPEFAAVYDRLRTSELLEYEEKVQNARKAAEEEFREQFLARLQENMKQAQNEFKELNRALKDIRFSNEKYEFLHMPSKRFRSYYEMIMDDFNVIQGESLFSGSFHENHKEVIDELFERLALDTENSTRTLDEFTDYRTYMDYDIRILHTDGSYSYYSKVCEEKSGGETQTPFYVTVAASFVQLYNNNIGGEAIGLVLFDEAFNNMDDERIGGVLKFLHRLPLQIVIAAPPDKIQYIGPEADQTLLVMTDEKISYAEEYHNESIRQAYS